MGGYWPATWMPRSCWRWSTGTQPACWSPRLAGGGTQRISPQVVRAIGLANLRVVATKRKLATLQGRPLLVDSGDPALDQAFPPAVRVWAGYREELLYPLGWTSSATPC